MAKSIKSVNEKLHLRWENDPLFNNAWINKFTTSFVKTGNKGYVGKNIYYVLKRLKLQWGIQPVETILELIMSNRNLVEIKPKRKAKVFLNIPIPVIGLRRYTITIKKLSRSIATRPEKYIAERIYNELIDSYIYQRSTFLKTTRDMNKIAVANRMYLRYRW